MSRIQPPNVIPNASYSINSLCLLQHGQCSWLEMQQFIGDLITSGSTSSQLMKDHQDALNIAWGVAGVEALGLKAAPLAPLPQARLVQDKQDTGHSQQMQSGAGERSSEIRNSRGVEGK